MARRTLGHGHWWLIESFSKSSVVFFPATIFCWHCMLVGCLRCLVRDLEHQLRKSWSILSEVAVRRPQMKAWRSSTSFGTSPMHGSQNEIPEQMVIGDVDARTCWANPLYRFASNLTIETQVLRIWTVENWLRARSVTVFHGAKHLLGLNLLPVSTTDSRVKRWLNYQEFVATLARFVASEWFHYVSFSRETPQICQAQMPFSAGMDPKPSKAPHMGGLLPDENEQIQRYKMTVSMNLCIRSFIFFFNHLAFFGSTNSWKKRDIGVARGSAPRPSGAKRLPEGRRKTLCDVSARSQKGVADWRQLLWNSCWIVTWLWIHELNRINVHAHQHFY